MKKEKKEKRKRKKKSKKSKYINLFIQRNTHTDRQTDRNKSFIDMRYYTEQYNKSNSIKENRIESNRINLK